MRYGLLTLIRETTFCGDRRGLWDGGFAFVEVERLLRVAKRSEA